MRERSPLARVKELARTIIGKNGTTTGALSREELGRVAISRGGQQNRDADDVRPL